MAQVDILRMNPIKRLAARIRWSGMSTTSRGIVYADPMHAGRHPFQTYMHLFCIVAGLPLAFGQATPNSIQATLPHWLQIAWGITLLLGSVLAIVGSYWPGDYANALTVERIGLIIAGGAALIFGMALLTAIGWPGLLSAALTIGFGLACVSRARDIGNIIQIALLTQARDEDAH